MFVKTVKVDVMRMTYQLSRGFHVAFHVTFKNNHVCYQKQKHVRVLLK